MRELGALFRDAALIVALSAAVGFGWNAVQPQGIPLVARQPYSTVVPCPVGSGEVAEVAPEAVTWGGGPDLVIDARSREEAAAWSAPGAVLVPYDFLTPVDPAVVADLLSRSARRVVVYGDGALPDTGHELAAELAGAGLRNVHWVPGGAPAVRKSLEPSWVPPAPPPGPAPEVTP